MRLKTVEETLAQLVDVVQALVAQSRGPKSIKKDDMFEMPIMPITSVERLEVFNRKLIETEYCEQIVRYKINY